MELTPGTQLASTVCGTRVVVVRPPDRAVAVTCGGAPMVPAAEAGDPAGGVDPDHAGGSQIGKRYRHEPSALELLCTATGEGALAVDGSLLDARQPKAVPSSD